MNKVSVVEGQRSREWCPKPALILSVEGEPSSTFPLCVDPQAQLDSVLLGKPL